MKQLQPKTSNACSQNSSEYDFLQFGTLSKEEYVGKMRQKLSCLNIEFYDLVGDILKIIGFDGICVSRQGDVNCRFDAIIIDDTESIPIEIKSPGEEKEVSTKAIRQACENKIVLLSRKFHKTLPSTTSLAIALDYPAERSDVKELIENIGSTFSINIGVISVCDLLRLVYDIKKNNCTLNSDYFFNFSGLFDYEKAISCNTL